MLTIQEALEFAKVTRKTLYNRMNKGDLAFYVNDDGRRLFDPNDLERVFKKKITHLKKTEITQVKNQQITQVHNPYTPADIALLIEQAIDRAIQPLHREIDELKQQIQLMIEYKPESASKLKGKKDKSVKDFADLLDFF